MKYKTLSMFVISTSFLTMGVRACEPEDVVTVVATCTGDCRCALDNCICESGDCGFECGDSCSTVCDRSAIDCGQTIEAVNALTTSCKGRQVCALSAGEGSLVVCEGQATCNATLGPKSSVECGESAICDFDIGAGSAATCSGLEGCVVDAGDGSTIRCGAAGCKIACEGGCKIVGCGNDGVSCDITCADGEEPRDCLGSGLRCGDIECFGD